ncbi:aldehyde dehydrogenase family protein [Modicisalibacter tunisiensis]|uniref:aldehyde dehydrogenase (NAD(+)) n=1 Tax=Modicisalibacter tunisiensis TaxID=390637 RepID=A0ABS7WZG0_9GAMM|nr:aldehyde dehydrogenase family protein [Modicisalibacter tunisiensis]MBZ9568021.1 aldehyde dehydrogenase family protein [Modicisalibacter tunisiensis]
MSDSLHQFIDGRWVTSRATRRLAIIDPYRETLLGHVTAGDARDVEAAVAAARRALPAWRERPGSERAAYLDAMADALAGRHAGLVETIARNGGKPLGEAAIDVDDAVACYRYYATQARDLDARQGEVVPIEADGIRARGYRNPVGVAGLITPWNFPLVTGAWKLAPALAAGCTVVFKPSEVVPLPEQAIAEIAAAIALPPGVLNLVNGDAEGVGIPLSRHPGIDKLSFTGSNRAGEAVMRAAAAGTRNLSLELGGKSPILVLDDADVDQAAELVMNGLFFNAGQMCSATSRLLVHRSLAEPLHDALASRIDALVLGDPLESATTLGPQVNDRQRARVMQYLAIAREEGLTAVRDPRHRDLPGHGYFIAPTLYRDVPVTSRLWREEIFGPVLCTRSVDDDAKAIALANDSDFGLAASVVGGDADRAASVARRLEAGNVWINTDQLAPPQGAWGGVKRSGLGRELGPLGLAAFQEVQQLYWPGTGPA